MANKRYAKINTKRVQVSNLTMDEIATPATPAAGQCNIYPKSNRKVFIQDSTGAERQISGVPVWTASNSYYLRDVVEYNWQLYTCITPNSDSTFDRTKWSLLGNMAAWASAIYYRTEDVVYNTDDNKIYRCITANSDVTFTPAKWQELSVGGGGGIAQWVSATSYSVDNVVWLAADNKIYRAINANSDVTFTGANWQELSASSGGVNVVQSTNITSATTGTWNTTVSDSLPNVEAYFWDNSESRFEEFSAASLNITISSGYNNIGYDTTLVTFDTGDYIKLVATYSGTVTINPSAVLPNYVVNSSAAVNTTGWATYADAAAASPVDGIGGSPSVTITRNTTTPLRGTTDFLFTKDAVNRQGQGASYDFSIDLADRAKPLKFSFDYKVSANFSYANNDVVFYVYDITNAVLIQPTPFTLDGSGKYVGEFQTSANSTSYRIIFHVATTSALAYTMNFTNVVVSATPVPSMINLQDKQYDISSFVSGFTGGSVTRAVATPKKQKDGSWVMEFHIAGTSSSLATLTIAISGVIFKNVANYLQPVDMLGATTTSYRAYADPNTGNIIAGAETARTAWGFFSIVELESMPTWAVDYYPVQLGDGAETRVVAASYGISGSSTNLSIAAGATEIVDYDTKIFDTHNAVTTGTNWKFTAPVAGYYRMSANGYLYTMSVGSYGTMEFYKNGIRQHVSVDKTVATGETSVYLTGTHLFYLNAGDYCDVRVKNGDGSARPLNNTVLYYNMSIERISGPASISAGEFVGARYNTNSGQAINNSGVRLNYNNKVFDTHNAVTTGASWVFTAPISGYYCVSASYITGATPMVSGQAAIYLKKNGSDYAYSQTNLTETNEAYVSASIVNNLIYLNAGDTVYVDGATQATTTLYPQTGYNYINIFKVNK